MYERSAIVLERYFEKIFGFHQENSLKTNYENYIRIIEEVKEYQEIVEEEEKVIEKFDEVATQIEEVQKRQAKLHESNIELENEKNRLFNDLGENPNTLDNKLQKIEKVLEKNNEEAKELREKYVKALVIFTERQKERNKYARLRRTAESSHFNNIENANVGFEQIQRKDVEQLSQFINQDKEEKKQEIINIMIKNGKNEKLGFNQEVIKKAVNTRMEIAQREAELYVMIYERTKKLLTDLKNETVKLGRAEKLLRDASVKLTFLEAEKEYIVGFLDNERMTAINGKKTHEKLMKEACKNFDLDIIQIDNLYELIIRETTGKSTKKAYRELYNKTYLKEIEEKEKNFEEEITNIKINMGTVINSNYWRIEGIKNVYNKFQEEVSEKFNKDLSEYRIEELEEIEELKGTILPQVVETEEEAEDEVEETEDIEEIDDTDDIAIEEIIKKAEQKELGKNKKRKQKSKKPNHKKSKREIETEEIVIEEPEEPEMVEDKIDEIIKNSRKRVGKHHKEEKSKGLIGMLFNK